MLKTKRDNGTTIKSKNNNENQLINHKMKIEIETTFKIDQILWFMIDNKINKARVIGIRSNTQVDENSSIATNVSVKLDHPKVTWIDILEERKILFASKTALVRHLYQNIEGYKY